MNTHARDIAKNAAVVSGATLLSRILGFVRDLVIAFALGAGPLADAFFVAFRVPNLLRRLFGEGSLTMAFVPVFMRTREEKGEEASWVMARSTLVWLVAVLGIVTLAAIILARPLSALIAPGFSQTPELLDVTARLLRICFPYIIFISSVALCMGILNARGHFLAPALAPCVLNIVLIIAALAAVTAHGDAATALAWGVLVAGILQLALQQPFLKKQGFSWRGPWSWRDPGVARTGRLMLPTVFGAAVYQINILLGTVLASLLGAGSISYLYYADRLVQFPLGVFGVAVSQAALPGLSGLAAKDDMPAFTATLNATLRLTLFICLPAMAGLMALAQPIVSLLFERGAFGGHAVTATAWALFGYGAGLPFFALVRPLVSAFYALEDTRTPVLAATASLVVYAVTAVGLMQFMGHVGLALAVSVASAANAAILGAALARKLGPWSDVCRRSLPALGLSLAMGLGAWATSPLGLWAVALIPAWVLAYALAARFMKISEAMLFWDALARRMKRRADAGPETSPESSSEPSTKSSSDKAGS